MENYLHECLRALAKASLVSIMAVAQCGCLATVAHSPESSFLCEYALADGWGKSGGNIGFSMGGVDYYFGASSSGLSKEKKELGGEVFWVEIYGGTVGRSVGMKAPAMLYDPREAVLDVGGEKVAALPAVWRSETVGGVERPASEISLPVNLNALDKQASRNFFLAFPISRPQPKTKHVLRLGSIVLDGKRVPLPAIKSCYRPSKWWVSPIH